MAKIAAKPVRFKAPVSIGADEYTAHMSRAEFVPTQPTSSFTDLDGKVTNFGGDSSWVLELAGAQDWETVNSLTQYMLANEGAVVEVTIELPGGGEASGDVIMAAPPIGGVINAPMLFARQLAVQGKPTFTPGA